MFHLDNTSGVPDMPTPKEPMSNSPRWFGESVQQGGISWPGADWFNIIQAELLEILTLIDAAPDKEQFNQLSNVIKSYGRCADIKSLRTIIPKDVGQLMNVVSYYTVVNSARPPQGGGYFVAMNDTTAPEDFGSVIRVNADWIWRRVSTTESVTPFMFGAVGDNVNDDSEAIQNAVNYASSLASRDGYRVLKSGIFRCASGRYRITKSLDFPTKTVDYDFTGSLLDFENMQQSSGDARATAIRWYNQGGYTAGNRSVYNLCAIGPGMTSNVDFMTFLDEVSYPYARNSMSFIGGSAESFSRGITMGNNTYYLKYYDFHFNHNDVCFFYPKGKRNSGEQINFITCVFAQSNNFLVLRGGHTVFTNCSFDYPYKEYIITDDGGGGRADFIDGWFEGYGPDYYVITVANDCTVAMNFYRTKFTFKAGNTLATHNPFFFGNMSRTTFDRCIMERFGASTDSPDISGWIDGTGHVSMTNTQITPGWPSMLTTVRTESNDNFVDGGNYALGSASKWTIEAWAIPPGGAKTAIRKNRWGYGDSNSTHFSLTRAPGYVSLATSSEESGGKYAAVVGVIPLRGDGAVIFNSTFRTYVGDGHQLRFTLFWAQLEMYGASNGTEPTVLRNQSAIDYKMPLPGVTDSTLKTYTAPVNLQGYTGQSPSIERKPDWATHAYLAIDITGLPRGTDIRIENIYMRQI
ncbi:hypothetical protein [Serratia marcescens]|uniref:hypothetical protein n=1 Tax=Serratia marcescens TaxID=615 RepID=UPI001867ED4F|nr:hypothetical protein [Serratia marcescens]